MTRPAADGPGGPGSGGRVGVLVNPVAGAGRGRRVGAVLRERLSGEGHDVVDVSGDDAVAAAARLSAAGLLDALVVVGGDGMVHLGLQAVAGTSTPLGVVPVGTGNDFAACLGLVRRSTGAEVADVCAALAAGSVRRVDAVEVRTGGRTRWVAGAVSAGLDAAVNARANAMRRPRGAARYTLAALAEIAAFRAWAYRLQFDGVVDDGGLPLTAAAGDSTASTARWAGRAAVVTAANTDRIGGGIRVAPAAVVDDGLLDVLVAPVLTRRGAATIFPSMFTGRHVRRRDVHVVRAAAVRITAGPHDPASGGHPLAHGDGEPLAPLPVQVRAVSGALGVLVPPHTRGPSGAPGAHLGPPGPGTVG
ncbi:hypothetical protein GCM10023216_17200 [Isoptericola chiayiensis]|uniref:DAGKc domain-containing protein n=1 Tax=Isoptericola chiayiensis TaxID=579446 RepID=A0ABP8YEK4_9MICO|nr:diacylglycerol kinase family protein [Isoptericola chiayiensis]NOV99948.1 diacylglycerol kinase (ATP) [Isoptericola chiayiensis]